mmetsp:Transcript_8925/g.20508  ORF Transcript_8925/g.20508 Transcript_8925/m.20508 type:complete len:606 (-) Transcript_8925:456-2273(-)
MGASGLDSDAREAAGGEGDSVHMDGGRGGVVVLGGNQPGGGGGGGGQVREHLQHKRGPVQVVDAQRGGVHGHKHAAAPVPHRLLLVGLRGGDGLGAGDHAAVPDVLPVARRDPHLSRRHVLAGIKDGGDKRVVEEEVLLVAASFRVLRIEQVQPRDEWKRGHSRCLPGRDQRRDQRVPELEVEPNDNFDLCRVAPGAVVAPMEAKNGPKHAVSSPPQEVAASVRPVVPTAVRVHKWLQVVDTAVDHALNTGLEGDPISGPPNRVSVLCRALGVQHWAHAGFPVRLVELGQSDGARKVGRPRILVVPLHRGEVQVAAPGCIVHAVPVAACVRHVPAVNRRAVRRRNREAPVAVEPPEGQALGEPRRKPVPTECDLLGSGLVVDGEGVVVEVRAQVVLGKVVEPLCEVREQRGVRVVVEPVLLVSRVAPVHIQSPDVDGEVVGLPPLHVSLRLFLRVRVPPGEPSAVREVGQEGSGPNQLDALSTSCLPAFEAVAKQKNVLITILVVAEIVAVSVHQSWVDHDTGRNWGGSPCGSKEPRVVGQCIRSVGHRGGPVEQLAADGWLSILLPENSSVRSQHSSAYNSRETTLINATEFAVRAHHTLRVIG